ncbi:MAG: hypothetical protein APG12_00832 [Candidatus Methanofastidiosum methylothiophilum]|uniref:Uncharacterized protein n=1 Tax=Candidatus Methanofastidiosum methylothiophilum TaxID=1705564 RepID=A0A150IL03_9EURY|nr:MAG: hypothetical protein APG10_00926 [Candidatus Methanofastidiosum methylthiophilus]KYC47504.1 MAG: hypothetical protein APG11_01104 [Candidatus Methanofastidiosum methylthiophilus]KYC50404.1 MAG: hypothetical protein APG12_00832 [Candidatus Methanofastidiosum methylthiophilus]
MDSDQELPSESLKTYLKQGNISLVLDGYEDLFSDFDPRPYSKRTLSDDFISECKKVVREKKGEISNLELRLLLPKYKRKTSDETIIKRRLKEYFLKQANEKQKELNQSRREGGKWILIGFSLSFLSTLLIRQGNPIFNLPLIITEPGGWFSFWTGLDKLFIEPKGKKPENEFYKNMSKMTVKFLNY